MMDDQQTNVNPVDSRPNDASQLQMPHPNAPHIAIWGTVQTGKTIYLAMLYRAFQNSLLRQRMKDFLRRENSPNAREQDSGYNRLLDQDWYLMAEKPSTNDWLKRVENRISGQGIFPGATQEGEHNFPTFALKNQSDETIIGMTFIDAPGELSRDPMGYAQRWELQVNPIDYLRACSGILCLLDPVQAIENGSGDYLSPITETLNHLSQGGNGPSRITTPFALCITKCDDPRCRAAFDDPQGFARKTFRHVADTLESMLINYRWFASSAIGYEDGKPANLIRRWNGSWGIRDTGKIEPKNIAEPFVWLTYNIIKLRQND